VEFKTLESKLVSWEARKLGGLKDRRAGLRAQGERKFKAESFIHRRDAEGAEFTISFSFLLRGQKGKNNKRCAQLIFTFQPRKEHKLK
jgi:hypothetical protein